MESPNELFYVALIGYLPAVAMCFALLEAPSAVLVALLGGWLFLPHFDKYGEVVPFLHHKAAFVPTVVAAGSLLADSARWRRLRPQWVDIPMVAYCLAQFSASLVNELGLYDALSALFDAVTTWLIPYVLGRAYFGSPKGLDRLANALVAAGLVYAPLALWEIRMSPQLHRTVYGYIQHSFGQHMRFGGFRPLLFLEHGIMVALFFACATLIAYWRWRAGGARPVLRVPMNWVWTTLAVTTVLCKSIGALLLLAGGLALLEATRRWRSSLLLVGFILMPAAYCTARLAGWSAESLASLAERYVPPERAQSLEFRFENEDMLMSKALQRPWLGWSRWGRSRVYDENGRDISVTDGMWIIVLGTSGVIGLVLLLSLLTLPALLLVGRTPARVWADPRVAPAAALAVSIGLWAVDNQFNGMMSPLFPVMCGSVASASLLPGLGFKRYTRAAMPPDAGATRMGAPVHGIR
jgi:hypothetical protein